MSGIRPAAEVGTGIERIRYDDDRRQAKRHRRGKRLRITAASPSPRTIAIRAHIP
jgi:hypothetical protein